MSGQSAAAINDCLATIPADASVAASTHLLPHLTHRLHATLLKRADDPQYLAVEGRWHVPAPRSDATRNGRTSEPAPTDYRVLCQRGDTTIFTRNPADNDPEASELRAVADR